MSQQTARKTVLILVIASLIIIGGGALLRRIVPSWFKAKANPAQQPETSLPADELRLNELKAEQTGKNSREVFSWPYDSAVPVYHHPNLEIYEGKKREGKPLSGIQIFLALSIPNRVESAEPSGESQAASEADAEANEEATSSAEEAAPATDMSETEKTILQAIAERAKTNLEGLGAEVILIDAPDIADTQIAAQVGSRILQNFVDELKEQRFKSERLETLLPLLETWKSAGTPTNADALNLFPTVGVSANLRLLLDVERQYTDRLYIHLKFGRENADAQVSGSRILYLGNETAAIGTQNEALSDQTEEQPAYAGYSASDRLRLAQIMQRNITGLLPDLRYNSGEGIQEQIVPVLRLLNLSSVMIEVGQINQTIDLQILKSTEQQNVMAEAITNTCFEYYCTKLYR